MTKLDSLQDHKDGTIHEINIIHHINKEKSHDHLNRYRKKAMVKSRKPSF